MTNNEELPTLDQELLEAVAQIVADHGGGERDVNSLYSFSNLLATSGPIADETFRRQLEGRLVSSLVMKKQELQIMNVKQTHRNSLFSLFTFRPAWQVALSGLVLLVFVLVGLLAFSSPARAFAEELVKWVSGQVTQAKVLVFEDGVVVEEAITTEGSDAQTLESARAQVDFDIRLPGYLPRGYKEMRFDTFFAPQAVTISVIKPGGGAAVTKSFELYESTEPGIYAGGEPMGEVRVNDRSAVWVESVATVYDEAGNPSPLVAHSLYWGDNGLYFTLRSYDLSQEEMIRIAESIE